MRRFNPDNDVLGVHIDEVTTTWMNASDLHVTVHFGDDEIKPNERFGLYLRWTWPHLSEKLLNGGVEQFYWDVSRRSIGAIAVEIAFDESCKIKRDLNYGVLDNSLPVNQKPSGGGHRVEWKYIGPFPAGTRVRIFVGHRERFGIEQNGQRQ